MRNFLVIANDSIQNTVEAANKIKEYCNNKKALCDIVVMQNNTLVKPHQLNKYECIIVIGGDGTLIQCAREIASENIPIIGVNYGKLGFLAEVEKNDVHRVLDKLLNDDYTLEKRMMIKGTLIDSDRDISYLAVNDIVLNRNNGIRIQKYNVYVNGVLLNSYSSDGVIISTPTGSTAYNLSAGGPIAIPNSKLIIITPICPHSLNSRSIILSADDEIIIEVGNDRYNHFNDDKILAFDGNTVVQLYEGEKVKINKAEVEIDLIKTSAKSFVDILRRKLGNNEDKQA